MVKPISFDVKQAPAASLIVGVNTTASNLVVASSSPVAVSNSKPVALRTVTDQEIDAIGSRHSSRAADTSKKILDAVKATDTEQFGSKLNELIAVTKSLDPQKVIRKGVIGKITSMFGNTKEHILSHVQTVQQRIDTLTGEIDRSVVLYTKRIGDIEKMYVENEQTFLLLQQEVEQAEELLQVLNTQLANEQAATDAFAAQRLADLDDRIRRVEKKVDDLKRVQYLCKLAAPELRLMQSNSRELAQTFTNIKTLTIPAYMGVYSRYVLNLEAKKGADLAESVADATNEAFRMQADLLRENTTAIAKAKQRGVVDFETLEHTQTQLLASLDEAKKIADEGRKARQEAQPKLQRMEQELISRYVPQQITH